MSILLGAIMTKSLFDTLTEYAEKKPIRFHMPSHNGIDLGLSSPMDITELSFSDDLMHSENIIYNTEQNIAKAYHSNYALMLTCGATSGIAIALHTAKTRGNKLAIIGKAHKSVYNYANVFGYQITEVDIDNIDSLMDIDVAIITSPDYFGNISKLPNNRDYLLVIDQSHGAHFSLSPRLPKCDVSNADIVVLSFHKTLPVLTGGAGIVCNDTEIYNSLRKSRAILHSSSPNYLIMASIDKAFSNLSEIKDGYEQAFNSIELFKGILNSDYAVIQNDDYSRVVIDCKGKNAQFIAKYLEENNIYIEMTYEDKLVLIVTPYNHQYLEHTAEVLNCLHCDISEEKIPHFNLQKSINYLEDTLHFLPINDCIGKVCSTTVGVYPPGTPILIKGDIITEEIVQFLNTTNYKIFGIDNGNIPVYDNTRREK